MAAGRMPELVSLMGDAAEDPTYNSEIAPYVPPELEPDNAEPIENDDMSAPLPGLALRPLGVVGGGR